MLSRCWHKTWKKKRAIKAGFLRRPRPRSHGGILWEAKKNNKKKRQNETINLERFSCQQRFKKFDRIYKDVLAFQKCRLKYGKHQLIKIWELFECTTHRHKKSMTTKTKYAQGKARKINILSQIYFLLAGNFSSIMEAEKRFMKCGK